MCGRKRRGLKRRRDARPQRLLRAHRMLSDPARAQRPIGAIAFEVGFGDLSYFNRAFRRRYGVTPSDVRANARPANSHSPLQRHRRAHAGHVGLQPHAGPGIEQHRVALGVVEQRGRAEAEGILALEIAVAR